MLDTVYILLAEVSRENENVPNLLVGWSFHIHLSFTYCLMCTHVALNRSHGLAFGGRLPEATAGGTTLKLLHAPGAPRWPPLGEGSRGCGASSKAPPGCQARGARWGEGRAGRPSFSSPETAHLHKESFQSYWLAGLLTDSSSPAWFMHRIQIKQPHWAATQTGPSHQESDTE